MKIDPKLLEKVTRLKLATPGVAAGRQAGDRRSPFVGRGVEFADYRPYGPGDDLRLVDWNVYTRLQTVLVRLFHEDRNLSVQIVVDASESMRYGEPRKIDHAGTLAAALSLVGMMARDSISLTCSAGSGPLRVIRSQNQNAFGRVLRYLQMVEPEGVDDPIRSIKAQFRGGKPDRLFFISDMLKSDADIEKLLRVLSASARRPVLLHVLSEEELSPDLRQPARIVDSETGAELRVRSGRAATLAYNDALNGYLKMLDERCSALRVQYIQAFTDLSIPALLNSVLRRRQVVQSASGATR